MAVIAREEVAERMEEHERWLEELRHSAWESNCTLKWDMLP